MTFIRLWVALVATAFLALAATSCVEDERSPWGDEMADDLDVKMPGYGQYYIGSAMELRGTGFSASDRVYIKRTDDITQTVIEAPVKEFTSTTLTFIIPDEVTPYTNNYVMIARNGRTVTLGETYIGWHAITSDSDGRTPCALVTIDGGLDEGAYTVYYQDMVIDEATGEYATVGERKVATEVHKDNYSTQFNAYPLSPYFQVTLEHNGQRAAQGHLFAEINFYWAEYTWPGTPTTLYWEGFEAADYVVLDNGMRLECVQEQPGQLTITAPAIEPREYAMFLCRPSHGVAQYYLGTLTICE